MGLSDKIMNRRRNFERYQEELGAIPGVAFMPIPEWSEPNYWLTCLLFDSEKSGMSREDVRVALEAQNIESRPLWKPMHLQPVFEGCRAYGGDVSARLFRDGLCLPSGSALTPEEHGRICDIVKRVRKASVGEG